MVHNDHYWFVHKPTKHPRSQLSLIRKRPVLGVHGVHHFLLSTAESMVYGRYGSIINENCDSD